jgi:hypothetical protein
MMAASYWDSEYFVQIPSDVPYADSNCSQAELYMHYLASKAAHRVPNAVQTGSLIPAVSPDEGFVVVTIDSYVRQDTRGIIGALGSLIYKKKIGAIGKITITKDFTIKTEQMPNDPWYRGQSAEASRLLKHSEGFTHEVCSRFVAYITANSGGGFYSGVRSEQLVVAGSDRPPAHPNTLFMAPVGQVAYGDVDRGNTKFFARSRVVAAAVHISANA